MAKISKLVLTNFRNFSTKKLIFPKVLTIFVGDNGVGKTNILESLTLLGRSSSLRGNDFEQMIFDDGQNKAQQFGIYSELQDHDVIDNVGISFGLVKKKKQLQVNNESITGKKQNEMKSQLINFIWLTPQIESLFILGKSQRRDYLDKIVLDIDPGHQTRINSYQKLLKERLLVLQKYRSSLNSADRWVSIIENQIVELGMAIASARIEAVDFFNKAINSFNSNFPKTQLQVIGDVEQGVMKQSAVILEGIYKEKLKDNRSSDLDSFKTNFGVHRSDFDAIFIDKGASAIRSSTGEQKAIMLSITLARAKISAIYKNNPTVLIFDEVVSHLDEGRKDNLFKEIKEVGLQSFFSATTKELVPQSHLDDMVEIVEI